MGEVFARTSRLRQVTYQPLDRPGILQSHGWGIFMFLTYCQDFWAMAWIHPICQYVRLFEIINSVCIFVSFRNERAWARSMPVSPPTALWPWKGSREEGARPVASENKLLPLGLAFPAPSSRWRRSPKIPCWNVRSVSITTAPGAGPSCWIANTPAAPCAFSRWGQARRMWGARGAGASPSCLQASPCRSSPTTRRSLPSLPSRMPPSTPRSSSNFPAMGATCCPCPSPRSERHCPETRAAACCQGTSRSLLPWWPSRLSSSLCRAGRPRRRRRRWRHLWWRRSQTDGAWRKAPPGLGCALWSWWPASWSSFWASCSTTCLAFRSVSLWYPVAEEGGRDVSRGCRPGLEQVLVIGPRGDDGGDADPLVPRVGLWAATWLTQDKRREQNARPQREAGQTTLSIDGSSFEDDCMHPHSHLLNGLQFMISQNHVAG